jgi:phage/conjugal plasmid C-4 type zinc finger TraR family protein
MKELECLHNPDEHMTAEDMGLHAEQFHHDLALLRHQQRTRQADDAPLSDGICEDCGNPIPPGRIAALPYCTRCVDCQWADELKGMAYGG